MQNAQWRMARCAWRWSQRRNSSAAVFAAVEPTTVVLAGTRRHLLTYASTGEHKFGAERLMASAVSRGGFHKTRICGPKNLDADFKKHNAHILKRWKGGGYWIYKSYILLQYMMYEAAEGDGEDDEEGAPLCPGAAGGCVGEGSCPCCEAARNWLYSISCVCNI